MTRILGNRLRIVVGDLIEQSASDSRDHRGDRRRHWCRADQFKSVQGFRQLGSSVSGVRFWRPPDLDRISADRLTCCITVLMQWCRWTGSTRGLSWSERSVRPGYPLSPFFYVLALEPQLRRLRGSGGKFLCRLAQSSGAVNIHWLLLCRGVTSQTCVLDMHIEQYNAKVPVLLELWEMRFTPSLSWLPSPLWSGVVAPDRFLSMGKILLNCVLMLNWIVWIRTHWQNWIAWNRNVFDN